MHMYSWFLIIPETLFDTLCVHMLSFLAHLHGEMKLSVRMIRFVLLDAHMRKWVPYTASNVCESVCTLSVITRSDYAIPF